MHRGCVRAIARTVRVSRNHQFGKLAVSSWRATKRVRGGKQCASSDGTLSHGRYRAFGALLQAFAPATRAKTPFQSPGTACRIAHQFPFSNPRQRGTPMKLRTLSAIAFSVALAGFSGSAFAQTRVDPPGKLFFEGDIVRHALMGQQGPFCVLNNRYTRGEAVAFRQRVLKPDGTVATNADLKSVEVELGNGQKLPLHYGGHGMPATDFFWSTFWTIPMDF